MRRFVSLASASVLLLGLAVVADEPKKPEPPPPPAKPNPNAQAMERLMAADTLIEYGRDSNNHSVAALVTAAEILAKTPSRPLRDMFKDNPEAQAELDKHAVKAADDANSPENLLKEAKKFAGDDEVLKALVAQAEKNVKEASASRNNIDGPVTVVDGKIGFMNKDHSLGGGRMQDISLFHIISFGIVGAGAPVGSIVLTVHLSAHGIVSHQGA
jgi:hypothetical protein